MYSLVILRRMRQVDIEASWKEVLQDEFDKPYFGDIVTALKAMKERGVIFYPSGKDLFNAFSHTPFDMVKVLLLGQDPYHGPGQANGLCFSVKRGIPVPPSLKNIFRELYHDVGLAFPTHGDLSPWAKQGVLMLNASLTVEEGKPMSHESLGWHTFTDAVIRKVSERHEGVIFVLWGRFAAQKEALIDSTKHHILTAAHPSPFSAHKGFLGCKHFSKINQLLIQQGKEPIDWQLEE